MTIFEHLYYLGYSVKKRFALKNQKKLPRKVISIGNITAGGTGKTPATIALAEESKKRGFKPCILTRGYMGRARGPLIIPPLVKGGREDLFYSVELFGDEPVLMAERLQDVPIVKSADRHKGGVFALRSLPLAFCPDLFILDDGFQHLGLFRDKDILLIDGMNPFGNRRLLPLGPLRETLSAIRRADIIVITKTSPARQNNSLIDEIRHYNTKAPIFFAEHSPSKFITTTGGTLPLEWAKEKRFFGFCGIGNPESFGRALLSAGIELTGVKTYRDHYRYDPEDIETIIKNAKEGGADRIVTTEKDIVRLKGRDIPTNLVALAVEFSVDEGFYEEAFSWEPLNLGYN